MPRRYIASVHPAGPAAEASGIERKSMLGGNRVREKKIHTDITKRTTQSLSIFLFPFLTDLVKVSLMTKRETSMDV